MIDFLATALLAAIVLAVWVCVVFGCLYLIGVLHYMGRCKECKAKLDAKW